jgi:hypothetical protein
MHDFRTTLLALALLGGSALASVQARADTPEQLDARSRAVAEPRAGVDLARRQIRDGNLLGALATLEGVMLNHPQDAEARLFHAGLLCRLDDPQGSLVEFDDIQGENFPDALWAEATAACDHAQRGR